MAIFCPLMETGLNPYRKIAHFSQIPSSLPALCARGHRNRKTELCICETIMNAMKITKALRAEARIFQKFVTH